MAYLLISSPAAAESFLLKDGKKITGTVFKRTDKTIWVTTDKGDVGIGKNQIVGNPDIVEEPRPPKKLPEPAAQAAVVPPKASAPPPPAPKKAKSYYSWYEGQSGYERAMQEQKRDGRPFLLYFFASWCPACKEYNDRIFRQREFAEVLDQSMRVRVDIDQYKPLTEQYGVKVYPTFYMIHPSGPQRVADGNQLWTILNDLANK